MAVEKKPFFKKEPTVSASSEMTEDQKNEINKQGLDDGLRDRCEELGVSYKDAGGHDLPRTDVEERIRKAEEAEKK